MFAANNETIMRCVFDERVRRFVGYVLIVAAIYGVLDELTQTLVGRSADVADWLADMVGATVGIWAGLLAARLLRSFLLSGAQKTQ